MTLDTDDQTDPNELKIRFVDGTVAWLRYASAIDFFLAPVFLKFFITSFLIYYVLYVREEMRELERWELALLWICVAGSLLVGFIMFARILLTILKFGWAETLYIPFITIPTIMLNQLVSTSYLHWLLQTPSVWSSFSFSAAIQAVAVVTLMEIQFRAFVAPLHPMIRTGPETRSTEPETITSSLQGTVVETAPTLAVGAEALEAQPNPQTVDARAAQKLKNSPAQMIRIGDQSLIASDLITMQIEDHYLKLETKNRIFLVRHKLSAAVDMLDHDLGLQVNRSVWVARSAINTVEKTENHGVLITMSTGRSFAASRSRISAVLENCRRWDIPVQPGK